MFQRKPSPYEAVCHIRHEKVRLLEDIIKLCRDGLQKLPGAETKKLNAANCQAKKFAIQQEFQRFREELQNQLSDTVARLAVEKDLYSQTMVKHEQYLAQQSQERAAFKQAEAARLWRFHLNDRLALSHFAKPVALKPRHAKR